MNLKECYLALGGDYDDAVKRLMKESLVHKFVLKFLNDTSYSMLTESMESEDYETAFRAAHTLKGVCQNLSFTALYESSVRVNEALRADNVEEAKVLMDKVTEDYNKTVTALKALQAEEA